MVPHGTSQSGRLPAKTTKRLTAAQRDGLAPVCNTVLNELGNHDSRQRFRCAA
jgi:hypothetical protein